MQVLLVWRAGKNNNELTKRKLTHSCCTSVPAAVSDRSSSPAAASSSSSPCRAASGDRQCEPEPAPVDRLDSFLPDRGAERMPAAMPAF